MVTESGEASLTAPAADADVVARTDGRVAVIGLGYTGLPLAIAFIEAGLQVEAIDANLLRVAELSQRPVVIQPDRKVEASSQRAMENYRRFLELQKTDPQLRAEALRAHAGHGHQGSGPNGDPERRHVHRPPYPARPADHPSVHDVPGNDHRSVPGGDRGERTASRH